MTLILEQLRTTAASFRNDGDHGTAHLMEEAANVISDGANRQLQLLAALRGDIEVTELWDDEVVCAMCALTFGDHCGLDCPPPWISKFCPPMPLPEAQK